MSIYIVSCLACKTAERYLLRFFSSRMSSNGSDWEKGGCTLKLLQTQILHERLRKMIYCTAAQQQFCVGNKAVVPKLFIRNNKRIVAVQRVSERVGLREGRWRWEKCGVQTAHPPVSEWEQCVYRVPRGAFQSIGRFYDTSTCAGFGEPVCSVMLFLPLDTWSSATTKGDSFEGRKARGFFKRHTLNVFFCRSHLLCCRSFEFASSPRAMALTRLPAGPWSHCVYLTVAAAVRSAHNANTVRRSLETLSCWVVLFQTCRRTEGLRFV